MRVRCTSLTLPENLEQMHSAHLPGRWPVAVDAVYEVQALSQEGGLWYVTFEHHEQEMPVSAPLELFTVIESYVSPAWNIRVTGGSLRFQPIELDDEFFCDDVQERRGDALERYRFMKSRICAS